MALRPSVAGRVASAVVYRLREHAPLREEVGTGGIFGCELRDLLRTATLEAPVVAVTIKGRAVEAELSGFEEIRLTLLEIVILTAPRPTIDDHGDFYRARLEEEVERVIFADKGQIVDADGNVVAEAATRITSVNFDQAALPSGLIPTVMAVSMRSHVDKETQEIVP